MFNSNVEFENPAPGGGLTDDVIGSFDPNMHKTCRSGTLLKRKYAQLRSAYTGAYRKWSASGHNDQEAFVNFCEGNDTLPYMFCVIEGDLLERATLRMLPPEAIRDEGALKSRFLWENKRNLSCRRKKRASETEVAEAVRDVASSIRASEIQPSGATLVPKIAFKAQRTGARKENVKAVLEMTDIEEKLERHLRRVETTGDEERRVKILRRLKYCSDQIEHTMREFTEEDISLGEDLEITENGVGENGRSE